MMDCLLTSRSNSFSTTLKHESIPAYVIPRYLHRVTDETSLLKLDQKSNFNTGSHLYMSLDNIIHPGSLDAHLDWKHRFETNGGSDPPMFISMSENKEWVSKEAARRRDKGRRDVRIDCIDAERRKAETEVIGSTEMVVFRDGETGCLVFSTEAASDAMCWQNKMKCRHEWSALEWITKYLISEVKED